MLAKKTIEVLDARMAYSDVGDGDPVVLLHGNPMHGIVWHALVPHIRSLGRLIIPDLIGMGDSARLDPADPDRYSFANHRRFLDAFLQKVGVTDNVILIGHDWGGALGFDWARRHQERVKGLVHFETHVNSANPAARPEIQEFVRYMRSPEAENEVLRGDFVLDYFLSERGFSRPLEDSVRIEILRPWAELGENRRAMLSWIRQGPIDGVPKETYEAMDTYADWLRASPVPKLLATATGGFVASDMLEDCRNWPNQLEVALSGAHFLQLDAPEELGEAIRRWHQTHCATSA
jgi:haloalkane dehalogenase